MHTPFGLLGALGVSAARLGVRDAEYLALADQAAALAAAADLAASKALGTPGDQLPPLCAALGVADAAAARLMREIMIATVLGTPECDDFVGTECSGSSSECDSPVTVTADLAAPRDRRAQAKS